MSNLYLEINSARRARDAAKGTPEFATWNARVGALYAAVLAARASGAL